MYRWEVLTRGNGEEYMKRLTIIKLFGYKLMLHVFLAGDDECLHDHPWNFLSLILWGGYHETTPEGCKWYGPGRLLYRPGTWTHRIEIGEARPITLVLAGPKTRDWGFYTPSGWLPWHVYSHEEHCK